ncbi:hypothetical protein HBI52_143350 [Parastagonospora nodorum]|nr:hypothetical protein HBH51_112700 [Parastagonospora nodorum]KAH4133252.1 hypothetical protein HBH47_006870 [Parastagonospora nodorum]KAH4821549.1 hypothetical protein HBH61_016680 [Parastagonospora nodorum]KAH4861548.1 hypothetical protein HBH75_026900 [Parastagonospora nodorum]KAH4934550.1 hypothetical protein HBI79_087290 [Parastagonospora nodorum]
MADNDPISSDAFAKLKVAQMKEILKDLHDSKQHGRVKRYGTKDELTREYRRIVGGAATVSTQEDDQEERELEEEAEQAGPDLEQIARAQAMFDAVMPPTSTALSKTTRKIMKDFRYPGGTYKARKDDISDTLEQLYGFCNALDTALTRLDVSADHSANHDALGAELERAYFQVRLDDARFADFFLAQGLDLKEPDHDMQMGMQAAMAGADLDAMDKAIKEEVNMLKLVVQHRIYTWIETFPMPEGDDIIYPQDFVDTDRRALRDFVMFALDKFQEEDEDEEGEVDYWARGMSDEDIDGLVGRLDKLPYPLESGYGHNRTVLRAVLRDVHSNRSRSVSLSRSRSRSKSVAGSERSISPTKSLPPMRRDDDGDDDDDEDPVVAESSKRSGKKRTRVSGGVRGRAKKRKGSG